MAPFSKDISFLFLTTLLLSLQIHARDSQFFSKVTHVNNNGKETELPNKEEPMNQPEQELVFIPETDNSYGLYGHESGQFPPTTTTTSYQPYKTQSEEDMSKYPTNKYSYYNKDAYNTNQNDFSNTKLTGAGYSSSSSSSSNYFFNKDGYGGNQNELGNTKYREGGYNSMSNQNNKKKYNSNDVDSNRYYNNDNNNAANDGYYYSNNAANSRNNGERQGMSDTRFIEGGKYYYNVDSEKYNPTFYGDSSRGINSENWNNRGYFGNNNANPYERNSMEGYQNKEFQGNKDVFEP